MIQKEAPPMAGLLLSFLDTSTMAIAGAKVF
jgi:hypothetical protein